MKIFKYFALVAVFLIIRSYFVQRRLRLRFEASGVKTADHLVPVLGHLLYMFYTDGMKKFCQKSIEGRLKYGRLYLLFFLDMPFLQVSDPTLIKVILGSKYSIYDRSHVEQDHFAELLGGGLILESNGEKWRTHRRLLTNGFHQTKLAATLTNISTNAHQFFETLPLNQVIDIQDAMQDLAFTIMCEFSVGIPMKELQTLNEGNSVAQLWIDILEHTQSRLFPIPYWKFIETKAVKKYNHGMSFLKRVIHLAINRELENQTKANLESKQTLLSYMVQQHLAYPDELTVDEMQQQVLTFLFAGHDTTSNLLSHMIHHIANDQEIKENCVKEIREVFYGKPLNYVPTLEDLKELRYLKMVLKETLRLYPGAPVRGRVVLKEDTPVQDLVIPEGTGVVLNFFGCHMDPEFWENPEKFDPNRFSPENEKANKDNWMPFGGGHRKCIGEQFAVNEALTVISILLLKYDIQSHPSTVIEREILLTMRAKNGIKVTITPANHSGRSLDFNFKNQGSNTSSHTITIV